MVNHIILVFFR